MASSASLLFHICPATSTELQDVESQDAQVFQNGIEFLGAKELLRAIEQSTDDIITLALFYSLDLETIKNTRNKRRFRYHFDASAHVMIITIPTQIHEDLHIGLCERFRNQLARSGSEHKWGSIAASSS
ncbi:hypothetical protein F4806DRAFT_499337 [Annulohypoxylon nitens]|nr:hypothetical protein F4806DRAFT_499337 [Annulohypoxylon nitens]